jgi:hypothetical protein
MTKLETIDVELSDETFIALAKMAHERGITLNDLCVEVLQAYINGDVELPMTEEQEQQAIIGKLQQTVVDIVTDGVTVDTMKAFGYAFNVWCEDYHGDATCREIIQDGFDEAERIVDPQC